MEMMFKKATRKQKKLRAALIGPSGSGKTYTALRIAHGLGKKIFVIDSENKTSELYAGESTDDGSVFDFAVCGLEDFSPANYVKAIAAAENAGADVIIIDSLSHAWAGKGGAIEMVDKASAAGGNSFTAWRKVTPAHNALVDAIIRCKAHIIVTMRVKTEYVQEKDDKGKTVIKKVGLAPIQRDGLEYEFDVVGDINAEHQLIITKTRCSLLTDGVYAKAGKDIAETLLNWLSSGETVKDENLEGLRDAATKGLDELAKFFTALPRAEQIRLLGEKDKCKVLAESIQKQQGIIKLCGSCGKVDPKEDHICDVSGLEKPSVSYSREPGEEG